MKRAKYSDIADWFSLDRYDYVLDLSVRHVIAELFFMDFHYSELEYKKEKPFKIMEFPLVGDIKLLDEDLRDNELSFDGKGVMPICFSILCELVNSCLSDGRISIDESGRLVPREDIAGDDIYYQPMLYDIDDPSSEGRTGVIVDVDLDLMRDDEMIASFKTLLKKWREQTGVNEPESNSQGRFGAATIAKIHQYRIIPYLDIARWARANNVMVSNELYARLLFPAPLSNGEIKGGAHIRDTVKPFAESANNLFNSAALKIYYADNPHIEDMRFSDFLKLAGFQ